MCYNETHQTQNSMQIKILLCSLLALVALPLSASANAVEAANAVFRTYGQGYSDRIITVAGERGTPAPPQWHVFAYDINTPGLIAHFVVRNNVVDSASLLDAETSKQWAAQIVQWNQVKINSDAAFRIANNAAIAAKRGFDSADYRLARPREGGNPRYYMDLRDANLMVVGIVQIDAVTGAIVSQQWPAELQRHPHGNRQEAVDWARVRDEMAKAGRNIGNAFRRFGTAIGDTFRGN